MSTITISKNLIQNDDLIVLPKKEYESMKARILPFFEVKGKNAKNLDKRVTEGLKEYSDGKTETLDAFLKREYPTLHKK